MFTFLLIAVNLKYCSNQKLLTTIADGKNQREDQEPLHSSPSVELDQIKIN